MVEPTSRITTAGSLSRAIDDSLTVAAIAADGDALAVADIGAERDPVLDAPTPLREFWSDFSQNRGAVAGLTMVVGLVLIAVFAGWIAPHSPIEQFRESTLTPPSWQEGGTAKFLLGTDALGRDILSRLIHGVLSRDYPVVQGGILLIAAIVITVNLIVDLLYGVVNPRIRHG